MILQRSGDRFGITLVCFLPAPSVYFCSGNGSRGKDLCGKTILLKITLQFKSKAASFISNNDLCIISKLFPDSFAVADDVSNSRGIGICVHWCC